MNFTLDNCERPIWSPDSKHIAAAVKRESQRPLAPGQELWTVAVEGITRPWYFRYLGVPAWSPDGKSVAVSVKLDKDRFVILIDGEAAIEEHEEIEEKIQWSPDGTKILFIAIKDDKVMRVVKKVT